MPTPESQAHDIAPVPQAQALALAVLREAKERGELHPDVQRDLPGLVSDARSAVEGALTAETEPAPEDTGVPELSPEQKETLFRTLEQQYDGLPQDTILAENHSWDDALAILDNPSNTSELPKINELMSNGGRLYAVMGDGSLEIQGNSERPMMLVSDNEGNVTGLIHNRDPEQMAAAQAKIDADEAKWASIEEMLKWAEKNGYDVFEADTTRSNRHGKLMELSAKTGLNGKFVGGGGEWLATALGGCRFASFYPGGGVVIVFDPIPQFRLGGLGLVPRLRVYG